jgi:glutamyl-tRNA reductase
VTLLLVGLNHRSAPVELRERIALTRGSLQFALQSLCGPTAERITEVVIVSTCNRLEIYALADRAQAGADHIMRYLAEQGGIESTSLLPYLYTAAGDEAAQHLMQVACGLDSMILGEPQILGQVTQAYADAQLAGTTGPILSHLFAQAAHAGKRARTETSISRHTTSVSHTGAMLVRDRLGELEHRHILIIGAGEMAVLAAQSLYRMGARNLAFINRTFARAEELAAQIGGRSLAWSQIDEAFVWADAIVSATGAPHTVVYARDVADAMPCRGGRSLLLVDIAVPRDIEPAVRDVPSVEICDIDDLQSTVDTNASQRQAAVPEVEAIIEQEMTTFLEWYHSRQVTPVIKTLRDLAKSMAEDEVAQALNRLPDSDPRTEKIVQQLAHRLINRLLHEPTVRLRSHAAEGNGYGYAHAVRELFNLDSTVLGECDRSAAGCLAKSNGHSSDHEHQHANGETHQDQGTGCGLECILNDVERRNHEHERLS